jgi:hypothetical protein
MDDDPVVVFRPPTESVSPSLTIGAFPVASRFRRDVLWSYVVVVL